MVLKQPGKLKAVVVILEKKQILYLKRNGIARSKFMRQAVEAYKLGKWDYKFITQKDEELE